MPPRKNPSVAQDLKIPEDKPTKTSELNDLKARVAELEATRRLTVEEMVFMETYRTVLTCVLSRHNQPQKPEIAKSWADQALDVAQQVVAHLKSNNAMPSKVA